MKKIFLLHEVLQLYRAPKGDRMSRHLYDLEKIMDTEHGLSAITDFQLFAEIASFREKFNHLRYLDYSGFTRNKITFVPPQTARMYWEKDYKQLCENMIAGSYCSFPILMQRLSDLQSRLRE